MEIIERLEAATARQEAADLGWEDDELLEEYAATEFLGNEDEIDWEEF